MLQWLGPIINSIAFLFLLLKSIEAIIGAYVKYESIENIDQADIVANSFETPSVT